MNNIESENYFDRDIITGFDGKEIIDKYNIFDSVLIKRARNSLIYDLYYELGYLPLNYLISGICSNINYFSEDREYSKEEIYNESLRELKITLEFLSPILKEGKLKVRLTKEQKLEVSDTGTLYYKPIIRKEYLSEETDEAVNDIKKYFMLCKDQEERSFFTMWRVQFTLPENKWVD